MNVVHIITRLIIGGAQENTLYNCEDLALQFGDKVTLITGPAEGPEGDLFERAKRTLDVRVLPALKRRLDPKADWSAYRQLRTMLNQLKPDVVHTHSSKAGILGREAAANCRIPAIIHTIHGLPFHPYEKWWRNQIYILSERRAAKKCHKIISVADAMTIQALAAGVGKPDQYITIQSGMEVEPFLNPPVPRDDVRRQLGIAEDRIVVAKVARLFELKGHDDIIDAARTVVPKFPAVLFLFVGGGIWRERLQSRIRELGMERNFHFTGLVPPARIPELINAADLVVHASYREGLARVLPQAFLSGKAIVSYDVDGAKEVVLPGETGFLAPAGDVGKLAEGLCELLADPQKRNRMGNLGRQKFTDLFRHQRMTERIRNIYEEVLGGNAKR